MRREPPHDNPVGFEHTQRGNSGWARVPTAWHHDYPLYHSTCRPRRPSDSAGCQDRGAHKRAFIRDGHGCGRGAVVEPRVLHRPPCFYDAVEVVKVNAGGLSTAMGVVGSGKRLCFSRFVADLSCPSGSCRQCMPCSAMHAPGGFKCAFMS